MTDSVTKGVAYEDPQLDNAIIGKSGGKVGFYGTSPVTKPTALTTALTTITHSEPSSPDYAIAALTNSSPYGFASADEGHSVLKVIANLQARINGLETKLQALGLLA